MFKGFVCFFHKVKAYRGAMRRMATTMIWHELGHGNNEQNKLDQLKGLNELNELNELNWLNELNKLRKLNLQTR